MDISTKLLTLVILVFFSALFSGVETAIVALNKLRIRHLLEKKRKNAEILSELKERSHKTISTLLIGNNVVNIGASALSTSIAIDYFGDSGVAIATGIMTFVILVFAEITPKSIANTHAEAIGLFFAKPLRFLSWLFTPISKFLDLFTKVLVKSFGGKKDTTTITEDEIKSIVNISEEEGAIKPLEKQMIHNIFKFNDIEVMKVLTSKVDTLCFDSKEKAKDVLDKMIKSGHSRFPIYGENVDNVIGIVYLKDLIKETIGNKSRKNPQLKTFAKTPYFIPESKKIDILLKEFQRKKVHMAVVVDEYGVFTGIATIEDLLEEIVGEIYDEQDKVIDSIKVINEKKAIILGDTPIKEVNASLRTGIRFDPYETISVYLLQKMGKIPKAGERIENKKYTFVIKEMDKNRIVKVEAIKK